jgi:integrase/recombinase XerD
MKVALYTRERGTRRYTKHNPKKTYAFDTLWVLRYGSTWETLDANALGQATSLRLRRQIELDGGWRPVRQAKPHKVLMLDSALDTYLAEIEKSRKPRTYRAYKLCLKYFYQCIGNKPIKDIERGDMLKFAAFLRDDKNLAPRSAYNNFESAMAFLKRFDAKPKISAHDWPQYVEEEPEIYDEEMLALFLGECDADERLLFQFFLMTGMREQEVIYITDKCVDFKASTVTVRHNPQFGWTPKMYKERTIPVPEALTKKIKAMLVARGKGGLLFPTSSGKPKYNFLDIAKSIAKRAGIPEAEVWLHKFRATFCTRALWAGIDLRTVQDWMGHSDLASTMRYLRPDRSEAMRRRVEAIWSSSPRA